MAAKKLSILLSAIRQKSTDPVLYRAVRFSAAVSNSNKATANKGMFPHLTQNLENDK